MALKKDKQKVLGEVFDSERVKSFLECTEQKDRDTDFVVLERAYRGMKAENFSTFIKFYCEDNRNLDAKNEEGKTLAQLIATHRTSEEYLEILKSAGASI